MPILIRGAGGGGGPKIETWTLEFSSISSNNNYDITIIYTKAGDKGLEAVTETIHVKGSIQFAAGTPVVFYGKCIDILPGNAKLVFRYGGGSSVLYACIIPEGAKSMVTTGSGLP